MRAEIANSCPNPGRNQAVRVLRFTPSSSFSSLSVSSAAGSSSPARHSRANRPPARAARRACPARRSGRRPARRRGRRGPRWSAGARRRTRCAGTSTRSPAARTAASVAGSSAAVASSNSSRSGSTSSARASATSWRWPADSPCPRSPTGCGTRRQRRDQVERADRAGRGLDLGGRGVRAAVGDVRRDVAGEQVRLLRHDAEPVPVVGQPVAAHVDAVDEHGAARPGRRTGRAA